MLEVLTFSGGKQNRLLELLTFRGNLAKNLLQKVRTLELEIHKPPLKAYF